LWRYKLNEVCNIAISTVPPSTKNIGTVTKKNIESLSIKKSYVQASKMNFLLNIEDVLQIKETFLSLSVNEVGKMIKAKNSSEGKKKLRINITTR